MALLATIGLWPHASKAAETTVVSDPPVTVFGGAGLLETPSARFRPEGAMSAGNAIIGSLYRHYGIAAYPGAGLEIVLRATSRPATKEWIFPVESGVDVKVDLASESSWRPALALGARDLTGGRFASEYLVASKRYYDLDLTLGIGWGRVGEAGDAPNPLALANATTGEQFTSGRIRRDRGQSSGGGPRDWFGGNAIGFFGGVVWTPIPEFSAIAEVSRERLIADRREWWKLGRGLPGRGEGNLNDPGLPLNIGAAWRPWPWLELGAGFFHGQDVMAKLTLTPTFANYETPAPPLTARQTPPPPVHRRAEGDGPRRHVGQRSMDAFTAVEVPAKAVRAASRAVKPMSRSAVESVLDNVRAFWDGKNYRNDGVGSLDPPAGTPARRTAIVWLDLPGPEAEIAETGRLTGRAARVLANQAPDAVRELTVTTSSRGLNGVAVSVIRNDVAQAASGHGSPEEIWRHARILPPGEIESAPHNGPDHIAAESGWRLWPTFRFENSLFETSKPNVARGVVDISYEDALSEHWVFGAGLRGRLINATSELDANLRPASRRAVRSDVYDYARSPWALEHLYLSRQFNPGAAWHARIAGGAFEEMFSGIGGELLYRPWTSHWAFGVEAYQTWKRMPYKRHNLQLMMDSDSETTTGFLSAYYESYNSATTGALHLGRYLGKDFGMTLEIGHWFENGVRLGADLTWSHDGEASLWHGRESRTHFQPGVRLVFPLDNFWSLPRASHAVVETRPLGRDIGQRLILPFRLYEATRPISYGKITGTWSQIME
ncbi:putative Exopolysaccharide biosynthesis protein YbjH [Azospirillaceae bacterium]